MRHPSPTESAPIRSDGTFPLRILAILLCGAGLAAAQQAKPLADSQTIRASTSIVQVPVLVTTTSGELVPSLMPQDFIVTDDGVRQDVRLEPESAAPLSLVVLMQVGGAAVHEFPKYRQLETMLAAVLGDQPADAANQVSVVSFDSRIEGAAPFTNDISQWRDAIDFPDSGDRGAAIVDALSYAIDQLDKRPPNNRRAILLISQPTDDGSKRSLKEVLRAAAETNTTIYTFTFTPERTAIHDDLHVPPRLNKPIVVNPAAGATQGYFDLSAPLDLLLAAMKKNLSAEFATLTGGETTHFEDQKQLDAGLNLLANHIHNRYLLTFTPSSNRSGPHNLVVRLKDRPDLKVSARTGYWTP